VTTVRTMEGEPLDYARGTGWIVFAASILAIGGAFKIFDAIWAFMYDDEVAEPVQTILFEGDLTSWGWVWLTVGILLIVTGAAVATGSQWARWVGIVAASVTAIAVMPWIYFQPLWTMLSVLLMILVIYALAAHGARRDPWI
jgi:hypothetical protein